MALSEILTDKSQSVDEILASCWIVLIYNDDYTPVSFVRLVLKDIFGKVGDEASLIIAKAENDGAACAKKYSDASMAEVSVALVEKYKKEYDEPYFKVNAFRVTS